MLKKPDNLKCELRSQNLDTSESLKDFAVRATSAQSDAEALRVVRGNSNRRDIRWTPSREGSLFLFTQVARREPREARDDDNDDRHREMRVRVTQRPEMEQRLASQRGDMEVWRLLEPARKEPVHLFLVLSRFPLALALLDLRFPPATRLAGSFG